MKVITELQRNSVGFEIIRDLETNIEKKQGSMVLTIYFIKTIVLKQLKEKQVTINM